MYTLTCISKVISFFIFFMYVKYTDHVFRKYSKKISEAVFFERSNHTWKICTRIASFKITTNTNLTYFASRSFLKLRMSDFFFFFFQFNIIFIIPSFYCKLWTCNTMNMRTNICLKPTKVLNPNKTSHVNLWYQWIKLTYDQEGIKYTLFPSIYYRISKYSIIT